MDAIHVVAAAPGERARVRSEHVTLGSYLLRAGWMCLTRVRKAHQSSGETAQRNVS